MNVANELATYLDTSNFGTLGTDIFVDQIPEGTNGLYLIHSGGQKGLYVPVDETIIDIYCKNTSASDCIEQLTSVKNFIHRMHSTGTSLAYFYSIMVIGDIEDVSRDLEYSKVYKITVMLINRDKSIIS